MQNIFLSFNYMKNWVNFSRHVKRRFLERSPNLWWGDNVDIRFWVLSKLIELENKSILDVGCQAGNTLSYLHDSNKLHGFDIDIKSLIEANKYVANANFLCASMYKLPYKKEIFDVVLMMNVVPGWECENNEKGLTDNQARKVVLAEILRVLKPNGLLLLTTPNGSSKYYKNKGKGNLVSLLELLGGFEVNIFGWNNFLRYKFAFSSPFLINNFLRVLSWSELLWKFLLKDMKFYDKYSKSIGIFARKVDDGDVKVTISKFRLY